MERFVKVAFNGKGVLQKYGGKVTKKNKYFYRINL